MLADLDLLPKPARKSACKPLYAKPGDSPSGQVMADKNMKTLLIIILLTFELTAFGQYEVHGQAILNDTNLTKEFVADTTEHYVEDTIKIVRDTIFTHIKYYSKGHLSSEEERMYVKMKKCTDCDVKVEKKKPGQKTTFILIRNEGSSDKSWGPFLIVRNKLTIEDSTIICKLFKRRHLWTDHIFESHTFILEDGSFNLTDTLVCYNVSPRLLDNYKRFGLIGIYSGANGKLTRSVKIQKGEIARKHFQRVCGILSTTSDCKDLIKDLEELINLE